MLVVGSMEGLGSLHPYHALSELLVEGPQARTRSQRSHDKHAVDEADAFGVKVPLTTELACFNPDSLAVSSWEVSPVCLDHLLFPGGFRTLEEFSENAFHRQDLPPLQKNSQLTGNRISSFEELDPHRCIGYNHFIFVCSSFEWRLPSILF